MGNVEEITILTKYSPERENILRSINEQTECENDSDFYVNNLFKLSEIRWSVRAVCFKRILSNYNVLWNVWKRYFQNDQMKTELNSRIIGVKTQMESFHLFSGLNIGQRTFPKTDNLSENLQAKKCQHVAIKGLQN